MSVSGILRQCRVAQVGKSGGAWITQALLLGLGSLAAALPIISVAFVAVVSGWIFAVSILGRQMKVRGRLGMHQLAVQAQLVRLTRWLDCHVHPCNVGQAGGTGPDKGVSSVSMLYGGALMSPSVAWHALTAQSPAR